MTRRAPVYIPLDDRLLTTFDTGSIGSWLSDAYVRMNVIEATFSINDIHITENVTNNDPIFQSPYLNTYKDYVANVVIPEYLHYIRTNNVQKDINVGKILNLLGTIGYGVMTLAAANGGFIVKDLFQNLTMTKVPSAGNCYFCAAGYNAGISGDELRHIISQMIVDSGDYKFLARQYIEGCYTGNLVDEYNDDPELFTEEFPSLLTKSCVGEDRDCNECVWGGSDFDSYVANAIGAPVVSIAVERAGKEYRVSLDNYLSDEDLSTFVKMTGSGVIYYRDNQHYTINTVYVFPSEVYVQDPDLTSAFDIPTNPSGYVHKGDHFDNLTFK